MLLQRRKENLPQPTSGKFTETMREPCANHARKNAIIKSAGVSVLGPLKLDK